MTLDGDEAVTLSANLQIGRTPDYRIIRLSRVRCHALMPVLARPRPTIQRIPERVGPDGDSNRPFIENMATSHCGRPAASIFG
jgi:hypothetical protein